MSIKKTRYRHAARLAYKYKPSSINNLTLAANIGTNFVIGSADPERGGGQRAEQRIARLLKGSLVVSIETVAGCL